MTRTAAWLCSAALCWAAGTAPARVQAQGVAPNRIQGFAPDAQLVGGGGFGVRGSLNNNFLGRLRLGVLYAYEPWLINGGMTLEVGALAGVGIGGELEWNQFDGLFANIGLARGKREQMIGHLSVGYMVFGLEWQHAFGSARPSEALLFEVRLPIGYWWFTVGRKKDKAPPSAPSNLPLGSPPPAAAEPTGAEAAGGGAAPAPSEEDRARARQALAQANQALAAGDHALVSDALRRAYASQPDPMILLRLADSELAQGKLVLAADALRRFLATAATSDEARAEQSAVRARLEALLLRIPKLRLTLEHARGDERVEVDGNVEPGATLGYDVLVDPGEHALRVSRRDQRLVEQTFDASEGKLVRLSVSLPQ